MARHKRVVSWALSAACAVAFVFGLSSPIVAQDPPPTDPPAGAGGNAPGGRQGGGQGANAAPRPYATVMGLMVGLKSDDGLFKVHRGVVAGTDSVYFEIPKAELDKDLVWNVSIKKTTIGAGFGGQPVSSRVVRLTKRGDRLLLLNMDYSITSNDDPQVAIAVADSNYPAIIRALPVLAYGPNQEAVVDVTAFFMDGVTEFQARGAVGGRGVANDGRNFLERALSFPENINVESTLTFTGGGAAGGGGGGGGGRGGGGGMRGPSGTVLVHHSIMKLPEKAMMARNYDERVGYTTESVTEFGTDEHRSVRDQIINRFRLEKKDANAAVSDPVKPIVFYVDPGTPAKWVKYVKEGIESWQPAFEAAGFRAAIQAKEAPANDPEWSAEDARYSVVRWTPIQTETQSTINDPRSGEILSASVDVYPSVQGFGSVWYFVQAGAVDKRAQALPLPDEVSGALIRFQVAHGVGHALGLPHNTKASAMYTVAQIRDPKWVKENGFVPSVMDDSKFNYVAQPEDNIDPVDLIPRVGPYDKFAVTYGYKAVPGARTPEAEKSTLDTWVKEQETKPYLRYSTEGAAATDPDENPEAVGDNDAVLATTLGLKNLTRISDLLFKATSSKVGDPWDDLEQVYGRMVAQWSSEMGHVAKIIGGIDSQQVHIGQQGMRFKTVPKEKQIAAMTFLVNNAFTVPAFMVRTDVLRRIQATGAVDRVRTAQSAILASMMQNARLDRMTEQFTIDGATIAYAPLQFLADVRAGVWSEITKPGTAVTIYRRNLQRSYLEQMDQKLNGTPAASAEVRMLVKGELRSLDRQLQTAIAAPALDENTRRHLVDSRDQIATILDPRVTRPEPAAAGAAAAGGRGRGGVR